MFAVTSSIVLAGCCVFGVRTAEEPDDTVLEQDGVIEVWQYQPTVVAETVVEGDYGHSANEAFGRLAGTLFGKNKAFPLLARRPRNRPGRSRSCAVLKSTSTSNRFEDLNGAKRVEALTPQMEALQSITGILLSVELWKYLLPVLGGAMTWIAWLRSNIKVGGKCGR